MVTGWGDFSALIATSWEFCVAVILTGISECFPFSSLFEEFVCKLYTVALAAQAFFARRLWVLSRSRLIVVFVILVSYVIFLHYCYNALATSWHCCSARVLS
jgi:hypothetical protein